MANLTRAPATASTLLRTPVARAPPPGGPRAKVRDSAQLLARISCSTTLGASGNDVGTVPLLDAGWFVVPRPGCVERAGSEPGGVETRRKSPSMPRQPHDLGPT